MLAWLMNLDFAASGADAPAAPLAYRSSMGMSMGVGIQLFVMALLGAEAIRRVVNGLFP